MKAFDTDVLTLIFHGDANYAEKAAQIPAADRRVPIVVVEQMLRGMLNAIRQAEAGKAKAGIDVAYYYLEQTMADLAGEQILPFTPPTEILVQAWKRQKIKVGISDLRIAAICIIHGAILFSRNRRDFDRVPGLMVEYW